MSNEDRGVTRNLRAASVTLTNLDIRPRRMQIADALQNAILNGELRPGEPLIEMEIASRLGVSRGPVREALQILLTRDLIESVPYHGAKVRSLARVDIEEVYSLRTVLETFALRRVVDAGPESVVRELRLACDGMQTAATNDDWAEVAAEDDRFHRSLVNAADHSLLTNAWEQLNVRVRQIMALRNLRNRDIMQIYRNHLPIVDAIAERDVDTASELLASHIASASDLMVDGTKAEPLDDAATDDNGREGCP